MSVRNELAQMLPGRLTLFLRHRLNYVQSGKRLFDLLFSFCVLLLGAPIYFLIGLLIKLSSKGPLLYASVRVGKRGRPFKCWKFRTMCVDADARLNNLLKTSPELLKEWQQHSKLKRDPRITVIGRILRKTSLDELPQFWNVLKGELSVVGPRPHTCDQVEKYLKERAEKILSVRPGITGLWQTSGRNLLTYEERVRLEVLYVGKCSFAFDLLLIAKTVPLILFPKGAY